MHTATTKTYTTNNISFHIFPKKKEKKTYLQRFKFTIFFFLKQSYVIRKKEKQKTKCKSFARVLCYFEVLLLLFCFSCSILNFLKNVLNKLQICFNLTEEKKKERQKKKTFNNKSEKKNCLIRGGISPEKPKHLIYDILLYIFAFMNCSMYICMR